MPVLPLRNWLHYADHPRLLYADPRQALLAAAAVGDSGTGAALAAAIIGGSITAGTHLAKAGARAVVNTSPEPFSNFVKSSAEDLLVPAGLFTAVAAPALFLVGLVIFLGLVAWALPTLWRGARRVMSLGRPKDY